jgi:hypothetical protein
MGPFRDTSLLQESSHFGALRIQSVFGSAASCHFEPRTPNSPRLDGLLEQPPTRMITRRILQVTACGLAACGALLGAQPTAEPVLEGTTAVSSRVSPDYARTRLPDGSFQPEEYAFGDGGRHDGPFRDGSIDKLSFMDVARVVAVSLRAQNYVPAKYLRTEKLLIMLHWGTTIVNSSFGGAIPGKGQPAFQEILQRDQIDSMNARMLGFDSARLIGTDYGDFIGHVGPLGAYRDELLSEIEENRYFVILVAYDFQRFRKEKKLTMLWETRFSINEPRNFFNRALPAMAQYASAYFGQDSHGLVMKPVPEGQVRLGQPRPVGDLEAPEK